MQKVEEEQADQAVCRFLLMKAHRPHMPTEAVAAVTQSSLPCQYVSRAGISESEQMLPPFIFSPNVLWGWHIESLTVVCIMMFVLHFE